MTRLGKQMLDNKVVPVEWLRTQFCYDPVSGIITNAAGRKRAVAGVDPCYPIPRGYLAVKIYYLGVRYTFLAHRLGWALHTGKHSKNEIDHDNRMRTQNQFDNLVPATRAQNIANRTPKIRMAPNGSILPQGVVYTAKKTADGKSYEARISVRGRVKYLGSFDTPADAGKAYAREARAVYGKFARHHATTKPKAERHA